MKAAQAIYGIGLFIIGTVMTIWINKGGWFSTFASLFTDPLTILLYWMGLSLMLILVLFVIPALVIIDAFKEVDQ